MSRPLAYLGLSVYVVLAGAVFLWWVPNFFAANLHYPPEWSWRYATATGLPFGALLAVLAAHQSVLPYFRFSLMLQAITGYVLLLLAFKAFYYPPQANFFCALHLGVCGLFTFINYFGYRREMERLMQMRKIAA